jgi:DNA mismatch endonuclease (patch repair protein)
MVDVFTKKKRSEIMSKIGSKDSAQEMYVRKLLFSMGYRYRLHRADLPGKPDIVLTRHKKIIFVNGCFWHGHEKCKRAKLPETNRLFWKNKIKQNVMRDKVNNVTLRRQGWKCLVVWQCQITKGTYLKKKLIHFLMETL